MQMILFLMLSSSSSSSSSCSPFSSSSSSYFSSSPFSSPFPLLSLPLFFFFFLFIFFFFSFFILFLLLRLHLLPLIFLGLLLLPSSSLFSLDHTQWTATPGPRWSLCTRPWWSASRAPLLRWAQRWRRPWGPSKTLCSPPPPESRTESPDQLHLHPILFFFGLFFFSIYIKKICWMCLLDAHAVEVQAQEVLRDSSTLWWDKRGSSWCWRQARKVNADPRNASSTCSPTSSSPPPAHWLHFLVNAACVEIYLNKQKKKRPNKNKSLCFLIDPEKWTLGLLQTFLNSEDFMPADKSDCNIPCHVKPAVSGGRFMSAK